ncbi:glycosyltransferase family protein [Oceanidesulfovibrio indonesiensis]|nr:glycosyltransferase [Oceanidesulfovibrio indonesiensis]
MKILYISPSVLPSRAANAVHVLHQCHGFMAAGHDVVLAAKRSARDAGEVVRTLERDFAIDASRLEFLSYYSALNRADNMRIALMAWRALRRGLQADLVLSRNLYASYILAVRMGRPIFFETHQIEHGWRSHLQKAIMTQPHVTTIVISKKLEEVLADAHGVGPSSTLVLPDAAPEGMEPVPAHDKPAARARLMPQIDLAPYRTVCGYFGHLYPGRGIEIIEAMAEKRPDAAFLVFGGNDRDIAERRAANTLANLVFAGHVSHGAAVRIMAACDVLLMPYQRAVSIGVKKHDTARWMSPMKMFEYMGSGSPIISSSLPVLEEVLEDGRNALLAEPDAPASWLAALQRLESDETFARAIGENAHSDYRAKYTWKARAQAVCGAV